MSDYINYQVEPSVMFREDTLKLHILYLEKLDHLSKGERDAYEKYFLSLSNPIYIVDGQDL